MKKKENKCKKGADILIEALEKEDVELVFAYPGGASMEMHQSLTRSKQIRTVLPRFEQGGGFMAHGYARATGKTGVCFATSGPGATNLVTIIADAIMDSIPLVIITGQVYQQFIGKTAFQETDFFGMTLPIVKHSYLVLDKNELTKTVKEAFHIANTGRPGPVVIDIPKDVQQEMFEPEWPTEVHLPGLVNPNPKASDEELLDLLDLIKEAKQPVLYIGGGIISGNAVEDLRTFSDKTNIPVASTLMGVGAFDEEHERSLSWFGMHGSVAGNWAVADADLLICIGARFDDRITGKVDLFATEAKIVHIDIDQSEHNKNKKVDRAIYSTAKHALSRLNELVDKNKVSTSGFKPWLKQLSEWKKEHPFTYEKGKHISSQEAIECLYETTNGEAIITTGVGQHQMWAAQFYKFKQPRNFISSLGLGTMGFGLPAAIGAQLAYPDRIVVDIDGDGSFQMNIQELATAKLEKIPVKCLLINNQHLGMVMQWEDRFYDKVRGHTVLSDPDNEGSPDNPAGLYPDYVMIAEGYGIKGKRVVKREDLEPAMKEMIEHDGPYLLEVVVPHTEHVLPMIPQGKSAKEIIIE